MAMTRKHFEMIAAELHTAQKNAAKRYTGAAYTSVAMELEDLSVALAARFAQENPLFDRRRFLKAAGW